MNAHGRNCQTAGSAGRTPQAASLPNQTLFLVFFLLQNPTAPAAPGEGAQMSVRWLAREASRGPGCAEESQVSFEEQEVGQHSAVIREEPQGWGRGNLVPRAPLIILRFTSKVSGGGHGMARALTRPLCPQLLCRLNISWEVPPLHQGLAMWHVLVPEG